MATEEEKQAYIDDMARKRPLWLERDRWCRS